MDAQTIVGLAGIAGTLVAGLGGIGVGAWLERKAEDRREDVAIQRAARLIDADLLLAETSARICVEKKHWWVSDRRLESEGWQQYRDVIAAHLQWKDWLAVMVAVEAVGHLQGSRDAARKIQLAEMATNPETRETCAAALAMDLDIGDPAPDIPGEDRRAAHAYVGRPGGRAPRSGFSDPESAEPSDSRDVNEAVTRCVRHDPAARSR